MDSGMWSLGLLLIPVIGYAIVIFLIIKLIKFINNKTKKNESNNITINYNTQKENTVKIDELENDININKKKTNLYKTFIILSIIISIFLLPFVSSMTSKFPIAYPENGGLSGVITSEIANQIAIYVWPILIGYIVMLIVLIIKRTNYRKVYYPLSLFTLTIIVLNLGIIYSGMNFMWLLVGLSPFLTILLIILGVIGNKLDNNTIKKKTVVIVLISSILLLMVPILDFTGIGSKLGTYITPSNYEILSEYYKENLGITDLENYLKDYKVKKLNEIISQNFNAEIDFNNIFMKDYSDINYGQIPTIDELSNYVELHDPKIEIKEDLKTKEELLNYLVKLSKFFIKDFDTSNITYSQTSKYFRYKYDYTKLGINNYTDQYNGYGGYVLAGDYKYSEEQGRYVVEDEDTIVRINIMGNVTTFNIEDILKD